MQKVVVKGRDTLTPAEVSDLLAHVGLKSFVEAFTADEVCCGTVAARCFSPTRVTHRHNGPTPRSLARISAASTRLRL